jgi:hypothetical protein
VVTLGDFYPPKKSFLEALTPPFFLLPTGEISQQIFFHPHTKPIFQTIIKK